MRFFSIIASACLLATQANAWNLTEAIECASGVIQYSSMHAMRELEVIFGRCPCGKEPAPEVRELVTILREAAKEFKVELERELSKIDINYEEGTDAQRARSYTRVKTQLISATTEVFFKSVRESLRLTKDYVETLSLKDWKGHFYHLMGREPALLKDLSDCFTHRQRSSGGRPYL